MNFDWMSNPQYLAQVGHFLGGLSVIVIATLFSVVFGAGWLPVLVTLGIGVLAASYKEFIFDTSVFGVGEGDSWSDSLMDWSFYMLGAGLAMGLAAVAFHFAKHC
jgi:hypothetical protein